MCMLELSASDGDGDVRYATRVADIIPYGQSEHRTDSFQSLAFFVCSISGITTLFPRKIGETVSGRVCSPVASTCTASSTTNVVRE
jgi:hypothetical protein